MPVAPASPTTMRPPSAANARDDAYEQLLRRVRSEYLEWPRLRLTIAQACRLWTADTDTCRRVLQQLVKEGLVAVSDRDIYSGRTTT